MVPAILTIAMLSLVVIVIVDSFVQWNKLLRGERATPRPVLGQDIALEAAAQQLVRA
jgi:hypothetical protein